MCDDSNIMVGQERNWFRMDALWVSGAFDFGCNEGGIALDRMPDKVLER